MSFILWILWQNLKLAFFSSVKRKDQSCGFVLLYYSILHAISNYPNLFISCEGLVMNYFVKYIRLLSNLN